MLQTASRVDGPRAGRDERRVRQALRTVQQILRRRPCRRPAPQVPVGATQVGFPRRGQPGVRRLPLSVATDVICLGVPKCSGPIAIPFIAARKILREFTL